MDESGAGFMGYYDDPRFRVALFEFDRGNYDEALGQIREVANRFPGSADELEYYVAVLHHRLGNFSTARASYEAYLRGNTNNAHVATLMEMAAKSIPLIGFRLVWPVESCGWDTPLGSAGPPSLGGE
jgi:tetratricopeptide (TPR) repeat protein